MKIVKAGFARSLLVAALAVLLNASCSNGNSGNDGDPQLADDVPGVGTPPTGGNPPVQENTSPIEKLSVTTFAGLATGPGPNDGTGTDARFNLPLDIASDGTSLYVADGWNCTIRKIEITTGVVTTFAGVARQCDVVDGMGADARLRSPRGIALDGQNLYVTDNGTVRRIEIATRTVTTLAGKIFVAGSTDGPGIDARFKSPDGIAVVGTDLFVADRGNYTIRKVDAITGTVTTIAGTAGVSGTADGTGPAAQFRGPNKIIVDGNDLYVTDNYGLTTLRKIEIASGVVTTVPGPWSYFPSVGGGSGSFGSQVNAITKSGANFYVADSAGVVRQISSGTGSAVTIAGKAGYFSYADGVGDVARFRSIGGMVTDGTNLYLSDAIGNNVRKVEIATGTVSTVAGNGPGSTDGTGADARFYNPRDVTSDGTNLYVTDEYNRTVRKISIATGEVTTLAGSPDVFGGKDGVGAEARFNFPKGITNDGTYLYVTEYGTVRRIEIASGTVTTFAGAPTSGYPSDGTGTDVRFNSLEGITTDGKNLYVVDSSTVRKIEISSRVVTTIAGTPWVQGSADGTGADAQFEYPSGITTDGTYLYVADSQNYTVRKIEIATGAVSTLAGKAGGYGQLDGVGEAARFLRPKGMMTDGAFIYMTDSHAVRKIRIATGEVTTLAGAWINGYADGEGIVARFSILGGIVKHENSCYVVDTDNHIVRRLQ